MSQNSHVTITEFLEARIAEDEAAARGAGERGREWRRNGTWWLEGVEHDVVGNEEAFCHPHNADHIARHDPARVLVECAAKRVVIGNANYTALNALAAVYGKHPDYRREWTS